MSTRPMMIERADSNSSIRRMAWLLGAVLSACSAPTFDETCIKGRLSETQAEAVNRGPWGHLPTYNRDSLGDCQNCAAPEDRILSASCSDFLKAVERSL
jgi:hypothetical protein